MDRTFGAPPDNQRGLGTVGADPESFRPIRKRVAGLWAWKARFYPPLVVGGAAAGELTKVRVRQFSLVFRGPLVDQSGSGTIGVDPESFRRIRHGEAELWMLEGGRQAVRPPWFISRE